MKSIRESPKFMSFMSLDPEITEITEIPRPSVACLPGSPVAGLCTEEAVMTTRAVGANCSSILGIFTNHQTEAICERQCSRCHTWKNAWITQSDVIICHI